MLWGKTAAAPALGKWGVCDDVTFYNATFDDVTFGDVILGDVDIAQEQERI